MKKANRKPLMILEMPTERGTMSDLIRREDVEEALQSLHVGDTRFFEKLRKALDEIPSAQPERKRRWIPVTESLPKDNRQVLVYAQSTHFALAKYDEMMEPDGKWKKQWVTFDAWKPYYTIKNVIAWMPLPEPYRGE